MGITNELRNEILTMFDAGHTSENIADIIGVSEGVVEYIVTQPEMKESPYCAVQIGGQPCGS